MLDRSYRGPIYGEWQTVEVHQIELGRTAAADFATSALLLDRHSDTSEFVFGGNALMMLDEAIPPYMLLRLRPQQMAETLQANFARRKPYLVDAMGSEPFVRGPASFGTFHYLPFQGVGRPCLAFVRQWPRQGPRNDRIKKRLIGVVCDSDVDQGDQDFVDYVTTSFVPRIVDELR